MSNVFRFDEVESTQIEARRMALDGAPHGTVVVAETQTAGRGRRGRVWQSAAGDSLLFSLVLRPSGPVREAPLLTLGAAAGLAEALGVRVKWPNDLVSSEGLKLGGLLAELEVDADRIDFVVLGVGLNVLQERFPDDLPFATSLFRLFGPTDREDVLDRCIRAILAWSANPARLDLWRQRAHTLGRNVSIGAVSGRATALRDDGALVVDGVPVLAGEIA